MFCGSNDDLGIDGVENGGDTIDKSLGFNEAEEVVSSMWFCSKRHSAVVHGRIHPSPLWSRPCLLNVCPIDLLMVNIVAETRRQELEIGGKEYYGLQLELRNICAVANTLIPLIMTFSH